MPRLITHLPPRPSLDPHHAHLLTLGAYIQEPWNISLLFTRGIAYSTRSPAFISAHLVDLSTLDSGTYHSPLYLWAHKLPLTEELEEEN